MKFLYFLSWYNEFPNTIYNFLTHTMKSVDQGVLRIQTPTSSISCQEVECSPHSEEVPGLASPVSPSSSHFERAVCTLFLSRWVSLPFPEHLINRTLGCVLVHGWFLSPRIMHLKLAYVFVTCCVHHAPKKYSIFISLKGVTSERSVPTGGRNWNKSWRKWNLTLDSCHLSGQCQPVLFVQLRSHLIFQTQVSENQPWYRKSATFVFKNEAMLHLKVFLVISTCHI